MPWASLWPEPRSPPQIPCQDRPCGNCRNIEMCAWCLSSRAKPSGKDLSRVGGYRVLNHRRVGFSAMAIAVSGSCCATAPWANASAKVSPRPRRGCGAENPTIGLKHAIAQQFTPVSKRVFFGSEMPQNGFGCSRQKYYEHMGRIVLRADIIAYA
jgi:hypothetical protein